jgi:muramoyltetrapeptide carboxypeptidase LdcA involved in peptidoglycan recycling
MIGGCLDTLKNLIGTPYGDLPKFASRFSDSKLILYLENAGSNPGDVCRALWNMRLAGWFKNLSGLIFGRSSGPETSDSNHLSYIDALEDALADLNFPVLYDADIGHRPPQMTILNGSLAQLSFEQGTGLLIQSLV